MLGARPLLRPGRGSSGQVSSDHVKGHPLSTALANGRMRYVVPAGNEMRSLVGLPTARLSTSGLKSGFRFAGRTRLPVTDTGAFIICTDSLIVGVHVKVDSE
jgi:hypothetical protein